MIATARLALMIAAFFAIVSLYITYDSQTLTTYRSFQCSRVNVTSQQTCPSFSRKIHFVLPLNGRHEGFCKSLVSFLALDYEPIIINWGGRVHHQDKVYKMRQYLEEKTTATIEQETILPAHCQDKRGDIVVSVDAFDVWAQQTMDVLVQRFLETGDKIIFGAEKICWPHAADSPFCNDIPSSPYPADYYMGTPNSKNPKRVSEVQLPRWLNSGTVIGYAKDMLELFKAVEKEMKAIEEGTQAAAKEMIAENKWGKTVNSGKDITLRDQAFQQRYYYSRKYSVNVDTRVTMFQSMFAAYDDVWMAPNSAQLSKPSVLKSSDMSPPDVVWNRLSGVSPVFLHHNGHKWYLDQIWPWMWYSGVRNDRIGQKVKSLVKGSGVRLDNGTSIPWKDLCQFPTPGSLDHPLRFH
jgi:hypothetical protein